jgi:hypothetical protein
MVTSASLMVRWPAAPEADAYGKAHPRLAVGLHIDLGEWACRDGVWEPLYEVVRVDDGDAVAAGVARQLACFRRLMGCDSTPTSTCTGRSSCLASPALWRQTSGCFCAGAQSAALMRYRHFLLWQLLCPKRTTVLPFQKSSALQVFSKFSGNCPPA